MQTKPYSKTIDLVLSSGQPVSVRFHVEPPEPEVGYFRPYIYDWRIIDGCDENTTIGEIEQQRILKLCYTAIS